MKKINGSAIFGSAIFLISSFLLMPFEGYGQTFVDVGDVIGDVVDVNDVVDVDAGEDDELTLDELELALSGEADDWLDDDGEGSGPSNELAAVLARLLELEGVELGILEVQRSLLLLFDDDGEAVFSIADLGEELEELGADEELLGIEML